MPAPKKYNPKYHDDWAWSLAIDGKTDAEIADAIGVTVRTINRWKFQTDETGTPLLDENGEKMLSSFGTALAEGKQVADSRVERKLYDLTQGYSYEEREEIVVADKNGKPRPAKIRKVKKHVPPNVMAIMYWLNNRTKKTGKWTQKQVVALDSTVDFQEQLQGIADLINHPAENRDLPE